ncbi:hypothetical protein ACQW02_25065 [Humitalea sp. 24SJ18S-53]|uniref:hypothetical protein n=1 Tax=Humitalea sp. 24SJ18S-53 TaxID=3422307 RepID=UPI003D67B33B
MRAWPLIAVLSFGAAPVLAQGYDGDWFGTVDCVPRDAFDRGSTQARGRVANNVLTLRFGSNSVTGRIVDVGVTHLVRLEGSLPRGGFATFDGVIVTPSQIHARGIVGESPCNLNLTPAGARAPAQQQRQMSPEAQLEIPPAPPYATIPPRPNTLPRTGGAPGKFVAPATPIDRPQAGASIQAPQPIDRPAPGASVQGGPAPTAQAPQPAPRQQAAPAAPPVATAPPANPQVADRLACALAGTCGPPTGGTRP